MMMLEYVIVSVKLCLDVENDMLIWLQKTVAFLPNPNPNPASLVQSHGHRLFLRKNLHFVIFLYISG